MNYIETNDNGEFFNPISSTIEVNPSDDCNNDPMGDPDYRMNLDRWAWVKKWGEQNYIEKMRTFADTIVYVNLKDVFKSDFEKTMNLYIVKYTFEMCRNFIDFKIESTMQDIPILFMRYGPVDFNGAPTEYAKYIADIKSWGQKYGFMPKDKDNVCPPPFINPVNPCICPACGKPITTNIASQLNL